MEIKYTLEKEYLDANKRWKEHKKQELIKFKKDVEKMTQERAKEFNQKG